MSDSEWEVVEEEIIHLELKECPTKLINAEKLRVVGLDKEDPILQVDNHFFRGKYRREFGSTLFFDGNRDDQESLGTYLEKTELKLTMTEVHLSNKRVEVETENTSDRSESDQSDDSEEEDENDKIDQTNNESLKDAFDYIMISSEEETLSDTEKDTA